jgi:serine/threonine protein kinase
LAVLNPGLQLGPYTLVAAVGAGGMGEVYRAHDPKLQRDVALKVLPERFASDGDRLARFRREAQALAALSHPNIAAIFDFQDFQTSPFFVMEYVEGETLAQRLDTNDFAPATPWRSRSRLLKRFRRRMKRESSIGI